MGMFDAYKKQVVDTAQSLTHKGYLMATGGNISLRIAAVGLGEIKFSDISQLVEFKRTYQPLAQHRALYDEKFEIFLQIYKQMKRIYQRLNSAS